MNYAEQIGKRIRKTREQRGMTQADLAAASKVGVNYVPRLERGELVPSLQAAHRIARALGLTLDELCSTPSERRATSLSTIAVKRLLKTDPAVLRRIADALEGITSKR